MLVDQQELEFTPDEDKENNPQATEEISATSESTDDILE